MSLDYGILASRLIEKLRDAHHLAIYHWETEKSLIEYNDEDVEEIAGLLQHIIESEIATNDA